MQFFYKPSTNWISHGVDYFLNYNLQKVLLHHHCGGIATRQHPLQSQKRSHLDQESVAEIFWRNLSCSSSLEKDRRNRKGENSVSEDQLERTTPSSSYPNSDLRVKLLSVTQNSTNLITFGNFELKLRSRSCLERHSRDFHTTSRVVGIMSAVLSPTRTSTPLGLSKSPMSSSLNLSGEGHDDIGALSAGFDRRRTLRRRLSTAFDPPPEGDTKPAEKLLTEAQQRRDSIKEVDEVPGFEGSTETDKVKVQDVLAQLEKVISYRGRNVSHIIVEKSVKELCTAYDLLEEHEKLTFLSTLALKHSVDYDSVKKLGKSLAECSDENTQLTIHERLRVALIPRYHWLFSQIGRLEGGVKFLVDFRTDLSEISAKYGDSSLHLKTMNNTLRDKIEMWFAIGFLNLERVTWNSPCDMLQKISEYEAVHPMRNWTDLKQRVGNYRRCYVFTHGSMPGEPVVVLHTALTDHIPSSIGYIVANSRMRLMSVDSNSDFGSRGAEDPGSITTAIFYSITSTQKGLAGIELGNYLIKRVVKELQKEFPKMTVFSSLSPIPGFRSWFLGEMKCTLKNSDSPPVERTKILSDEEVRKLSKILDCPSSDCEVLERLLTLIANNSWVEDDQLQNAMEQILMRHCARYIVLVKRRGFALNSVANFHLKNGAVVWRLNWKANMKPRGVTESCGIMVNYRYFLDNCETNSLEYMESQNVKTSDQVKHLLRSFSTDSPSSPPPQAYPGQTK